MHIPTRLLLPAIVPLLLAAFFFGCIPVSAGQNLTLQAGWNFIAIPHALPSETMVSQVFGDVDSAGHSPFRYDAGTRLWTRLRDQDRVPGPLQGFWIYSAEDTIIPVPETPGDSTPVTIALSRGWNAIGFPVKEKKTARSVLSMAGSNWTQLIGYSSREETYDTTIIRGGSGLFADTRTVEPWKGYWLYMNEGGVLSDPDAPSADTLVVTFLSTGQGELVFIRTPGGKTAVLDTGSDPASLASVLKNAGAGALDILLLSGSVRNTALGEFLGKVPVTTVFGPPCSGEAGSCEGVLPAIVVAAGIPYQGLNTGDSFDLDGECLVRVLSSRPASSNGDSGGTVVYLLTFRGSSFLFTGGVGADAEAGLALNSTDEPVTVLQVSQQGDETSSSNAFLYAHTPAVAVIGVSSPPPAGLPSDETMRRIVAYGATLYRTDYNGDVTIFARSSGTSVLPSRNSAYKPPATPVPTVVPPSSSGGGCPYCQ